MLYSAMQKTSPHDPITSRDNSAVKVLHSLTEAKYRKKEKSFLIEGVKMVEEALREDLGVRLVVAEPSLTRQAAAEKSDGEVLRRTS